MNHLLVISKKRGNETTWGIVLAENARMPAFARKLGCKISRGRDGRYYEVKIYIHNLSINISEKERPYLVTSNVSISCNNHWENTY